MCPRPLCQLFFKFPDLILQILVPLELPFHVFNVSLELNLTVVLLLKLLAELVKFDPQLASLSFKVFNFILELKNFLLLLN